MMSNLFRKSKRAVNHQSKVSGNERSKRIQERGTQLAEISQQRALANGDTLGMGTQADVIPILYLFGEEYDYCVLKVGIDVPIDDDGSTRDGLADQGFVQLNESLFIHASQIVSVDLNSRHLTIPLELNQKMRNNLRGDDVIAKLDSYRVREGFNTFWIDEDYKEAMVAFFDKIT